MKIQKFNGSLATRLAPQFLSADQSRVSVNIDTSTGELTPVKDKILQTEALDKYFSYFREDDEFVSSTVKTDFLEFQGFMYAADRVNRPTRRRNGVARFVGIERPTSAPTLTSVDVSSKLSSASFVNSEETLIVGPSSDPEIPLTVTGNLPSVVLKYMLFIQKNGKLSAGYNVDVSPTVSGTRSTYQGTHISRSAKFTPDFEVSSVSSTSRIVEISNFDLEEGEVLKAYRYVNSQWKLVGSGASGSTIIDSLYELTFSTVLSMSTITNFNGTYQYVYTLYNVDDGTESAPSDLSAELEVTSGYLVIGLPYTSTDPQVTHKRIYRVGGDIGVFSLVAQVSADVTSYEDRLSDVEIDGRTLTTENYYEAPAGLKYITASYAMLFGAIGDKLRFTPIGVPTAWPPEYSLDFDDTITGIGSVANGLLVMTRDRTHIVTGTGPFSLSTQPLRGDQGCIAHESIQEVAEGAIVWASSDGLCLSSGNNPKTITKYLLGDLKFDPTSSGVNNEVYYLHNNDGTIFVWDYRFEPVFKYYSLDVEYIQEAKGLMYGYKGDSLYEILASDDLLDFEYASPRFIEGSFTERKTYNKFFMYSSGEITLRIYIDSELVLTKQHTDTGLKEMKVPQEKQSGYYMHFEIDGSGTVSEFEYEVGRRKNG